MSSSYNQDYGSDLRSKPRMMASSLTGSISTNYNSRSGPDSRFVTHLNRLDFNALRFKQIFELECIHRTNVWT
jgi:hypothetical protein